MARERSEEDQIEQGVPVDESAVESGTSVELEEPTADEQHHAEEALAEEAGSAGELRVQLDQLQEQLAIQKDIALRAQAELQNARRRAQLDVEKAHKFGAEKLLSDLLPVVDNLERALATLNRDDEAQKPVIEGIELTHKSFLDTLGKYAVEVVDPVGEPFDPEFHQAMTQVPNGDVEPNTVLEVFQKGYRLHGRLVRPALVVVSKAP